MQVQILRMTHGFLNLREVIHPFNFARRNKER